MKRNEVAFDCKIKWKEKCLSVNYQVNRLIEYDYSNSYVYYDKHGLFLVQMNTPCQKRKKINYNKENSSSAL